MMKLLILGAALFLAGTTRANFNGLGHGPKPVELNNVPRTYVSTFHFTPGGHYQGIHGPNHGTRNHFYYRGRGQSYYGTPGKEEIASEKVENIGGNGKDLSEVLLEVPTSTKTEELPLVVPVNSTGTDNSEEEESEESVVSTTDDSTESEVSEEPTAPSEPTPQSPASPGSPAPRPVPLKKSKKLKKGKGKGNKKGTHHKKGKKGSQKQNKPKNGKNANGKQRKVAPHGKNGKGGSNGKNKGGKKNKH